MLASLQVAVAQQESPHVYPSSPPFNPPVRYPESPFEGPLNPGNTVYSTVREALRLLELDIIHFGDSEWNPLGAFIQPGDQVLLKPNFVRHINGSGGDLFSVITHGAVLRAVLDYVRIALQGRGWIVIGDAPLQSADMDSIRRATGIDLVIADFRSRSDIQIDFIDFRLEQAHMQHGMIVGREALSEATSAAASVATGKAKISPTNPAMHTSVTEDQSDYRMVELGAGSYLEAIGGSQGRFRVTDYDPEAMEAHHRMNTHQYLIHRAVLESDVVINLPKLKTHRKVGLTAALKNVVGINGHKDWLPHHSILSSQEGGDEYQHPSRRKRLDTRLDEGVDRTNWRLIKYLLRGGRLLLRLSGKLAPFADPYYEGSWWGNDTLWRTALDLNRVLLLTDQNGAMTDRPQRRIFTLVDGIIAGEGEGPVDPTARPCGLILAGSNPAVLDSVCARLMGFDPDQIPLVRQALLDPLFRIEKPVRILSNEPHWEQANHLQRAETLAFRPPAGWIGHIELE